jgi:hypothetical protein
MNIGMHGSKNKYHKEIINNGINRGSSAWFVLPKKPGKDKEIRRSVFLSLYFALSLSTLKIFQKQQNTTLKEYLLRNKESIPCLYFFPYETNLKHTYNFYEIDFEKYCGLSLPYTKTKQSKQIQSDKIFKVIDCEKFIQLIQEDIIPEENDCNNEVVKRFFKKKYNFSSYPETGVLQKSEILAANFCSRLEPLVTREILNILS